MSVIVLPDISAWIEFVRGNNSALEAVIANENYLIQTHTTVLGELLLGGMKENAEVYRLVSSLFRAPTLTDDETLQFISQKNLSQTGIGLSDVALLGSCCLSGCKIQTFDKELETQARKLNVNWER